MPILPISFSIHKSKIISEIPKKTKMIAHVIPGKTDTYIFKKEEDYYNDYRSSYFGITMCKAGWDCMRHYEILANGCIPYFIKIGSIPKNTMFNFPKEIIKKTNKIYETLSKNPDKIMNHIDELHLYINQLLIYCRTHLTNDAIASYILEKTGFTSVKKILFLCTDIAQPDYLRCMTLTGFKDIFGADCHDWPKVKHIYTDNIEMPGFTFTNNVPITAHDDNLDKTIFRDIYDKKYDIIIYGSLHRALPFHNIVKEIYKPKEIIYLCGEDFHICNTDIYDIHPDSFIFQREINSYRFFLKNSL